MARFKQRDIELRISSVDADGYGSGANQAVKVRDALPGEQVAARILKRRRGVRYADAQSLLAGRHPRRRDEACEYFPRCGGCAMAHMHSPWQLQTKAAALRTALNVEGVLAEQWREPTAGPLSGYRTKARLGVRQVGEQVLVGFRESFSNRIARIDHCANLTPELSALLSPLKLLVSSLSVADAIPQIEVAQGTTQVALILRHLNPLSESDLEQLRRFERDQSVQLILQSGGYDTLQRLDGQPVDPLSYRLPQGDLSIEFGPDQFTQVNLRQNEALIDTVLGYLGVLRGRTVLDLFCGIGNFSLPLAAAGASVVGIESAAQAVDRARSNAAANGLAERCQFRLQDLYADANMPAEPVDAMVLDPPRSGAGPHLENWLNMTQPAELVYVSCNPLSFAKDAARLKAQGLRLVSVGIFDMFPHTAHVETIGYFRNLANTRRPANG